MSDIIELETKPELSECRSLVARLIQAQENSGLKDGHFVNRFRDNKNALLMGSQRTWERIKTDDWTNNNAEKLLPRLRLCVAQLDGGSLPGEVFDDLPFYKIAATELVRLEGQRNDRRVLLILAPTGVGKTSFLRAAARKEGKSRYYFRCAPPMKDKGLALVSHIYRAVAGEDLKAVSYDAALQRLRDRMAAAPCTLMIDEGHDGGIELMKIIRYLVDETSSRFVVAAYPTDYSRVISASTGALSEARQFVGRCLKPILDDYRDGTKIKDVSRMLKGADLPSDADFADIVYHTISNREGLRTLADAIEDAQTTAMASDREIRRDDLTASLAKITGANRGRKEVGK